MKTAFFGTVFKKISFKDDLVHEELQMKIFKSSKRFKFLLDKEALLRAVRLRRDLEPFFDGAGIAQYSQDPNLADPPISGGPGGLISEPLTSHPIMK